MAPATSKRRIREAVTPHKPKEVNLLAEIYSITKSGGRVYKINDIIIYGKMGACKITDITKPKHISSARNQLYYVMKSLHDNCIIYTPVNTKVFMRPIISAEEAERLIDMIPTIRGEAFYSDSAQALAKHYESAMANHDCVELIKLTMSIHAKNQEAEQQNKKIGQIDQKFRKQAEEILFSEIAYAIGIPKDKVRDYIAERVEGRERKLA